MQLVVHDLFTDAVDPEGNLGDQNHVRRPGDAAVERDPARITSHYLDHHHPLMGAGGGVQFIDRLRRCGHRRVEAEGDDRAGQVVIDRLGHAHHRHPHPGEAVGDTQGAVAADGDQDVQAQAPEVAEDPCGDIPNLGLADGVLDRHRERIPLVRRAEDRAAQRDDACHFLRRQPGDLIGIQQAVITGMDAVNLPAAAVGCHRHGIDDGVESGCIPAAGIDRDLQTFIHCSLLIFVAEI